MMTRLIMQKNKKGSAVDHKWNIWTFLLLVWQQEWHPACKNWVVIYLEWGANDLHMVQLMPLPPHHLLLIEIKMVYLSGAGLPRMSWKKTVKWM